MNDSIAAVILAGGVGTRLGGVRKSDVRVGGIRLIERVLAAIAEDCDPVLVAIGHDDPAVMALPASVIPVVDLTEGQHGPLAGLAAGVGWFRGKREPSRLLSVAVDTPFFPQSFTSCALAALSGGADVAVAAYAGQPYPTNTLWRFGAIRDLPQRLIAGDAPHSLRRLLAAADSVVVDWPVDPSGDPFANVNTPDDLEALERRARGR
jgi:molybdopterin-guanine dinucleotide biosynthesis protein A